MGGTLLAKKNLVRNPKWLRENSPCAGSGVNLGKCIDARSDKFMPNNPLAPQLVNCDPGYDEQSDSEEPSRTRDGTARRNTVL
jgi:hypothetical protein